MSLVQLVITDDFILMGGEKRVIDKDNNILAENVNKVVKLNNDIIIGFTGKLRDCYDFIKDYCDFSLENGFYKKSFSLNYNELIANLCKKYQQMCKIHNDKNIEKEFEISIIVAGYDGENLVNHSFNLHPFYMHFEKDGVFREYKSNTQPCLQIVNGGNGTNVHFSNLNTQIKQLNPKTILQYKNIMKTVFDYGAKVDITINNNYNFEKIRKVDVR